MSNFQQDLSRAVQARLVALHSSAATYRTSGTALAQPADVARRVASLLHRGAQATRRSAFVARG